VFPYYGIIIILIHTKNNVSNVSGARMTTTERFTIVRSQCNTFPNVMVEIARNVNIKVQTPIAESKYDDFPHKQLYS
jgi:hypothetical protein